MREAAADRAASFAPFGLFPYRIAQKAGKRGEDMAQETEREVLCRELAQADSSLGFLLLFVMVLLISFWSTATGCRRLCLLLRGEEEAAAALPDTYPLQRLGGASAVAALGFFLCLAWDGFRRAGNAAARRSAWANLWAAALALAAGILRLWTLDFAKHCLQTEAGADSDLPD